MRQRCCYNTLNSYSCVSILLKYTVLVVQIFFAEHKLFLNHNGTYPCQTSAVVEEYVMDTLVRHLEFDFLCVGDSAIIHAIQHALLENAHGM